VAFERCSTVTTDAHPTTTKGQAGGAIYNYQLHNFVHHTMFSIAPIKRVGRTCSTLEGHENAHKMLAEKSEGKSHLDLRVDSSIILKQSYINRL
jgi:hypothetical protein